MRKICAIMLVLALVLASFSVAFAADPQPDYIESVEAESNVASEPVTITYVGDKGGKDVYRVEVKWGNMEFTYTDVQSDTWNAENHEATGAAEARWDKQSETITVINHSSVAVDVEATFEGIDGAQANVVGTTATSVKGNVTATIENNVKANLGRGTGLEGGRDVCPSYVFTVTVAGAPTETFTLDNINITISKAVTP